MKRAILMTGDRPTGQMHLGHYVGSLKNRFAMQKDYRCFFMIADYQALTTHSDRSSDLEGYIREMVLDYLAAGFDPERSVCFLQSQVPQLAELTAIFGNLVTLPRLMRDAGLEVTQIRSITRIARPGESMWLWPTSYFEVFLPKIVEEGYLKETDRAAFMDEWAKRSNDPDCFFCTPPMVAIIARKPKNERPVP